MKKVDFFLSLLLRGVVGAFIVVLVTCVGDKYGPKTSGLLAAFPTVSATSLFIMAVENGTLFTSKASLSALFGLVAVNFFTFGFYYGYIHGNKKTLVGKMFLALILGFTTYSIVILVYIIRAHEGTIYNIIPLILSFVVLRFIFKNIKDQKNIENENSLLM